MEHKDFLKIASYGNQNWKGSFTKKEVSSAAKDYLCEYDASNRQGKATPVIEELCRLLITDSQNGSVEAEDFLEEILGEAEDWTVGTYYCNGCDKSETIFFSKEDMEKIEKHERREMCIQDALPNVPSWIRETFLSGMCLCPDCWKKYWGGQEL